MQCQSEGFDWDMLLKFVEHNLTDQYEDTAKREPFFTMWHIQSCQDLSEFVNSAKDLFITSQLPSVFVSSKLSHRACPSTLMELSCILFHPCWSISSKTWVSRDFGVDRWEKTCLFWKIEGSFSGNEVWLRMLHFVITFCMQIQHNKA